MSKYRLPTYFVSHGGGPWPWLKKEMPFFEQLEFSLKEIPGQLKIAPKAVLIISGHWEEKVFTVSSADKPRMIYDYGGFPEHTYHIRYDAPGSAAIAQRVQALLKDAGFSANSDDKRGFDHGTFVPMFAMYPKGEIPIVQLSMQRDFDPLLHLKVGRAVAPLRDEGILIIGSGLSYHNLRAFGQTGAAASREFDAWLNTVLVDTEPAERERKLVEWEQAPSARAAHPREDHLVPLFVAVGAAGSDVGSRVYHETAFMGAITASSFKFG